MAARVALPILSSEQKDPSRNWPVIGGAGARTSAHREDANRGGTPSGAVPTIFQELALGAGVSAPTVSLTILHDGAGVISWPFLMWICPREAVGIAQDGEPRRSEKA